MLSCEFWKFLRTPFLQNTSGGCFCLEFFTKFWRSDQSSVKIFYTTMLRLWIIWWWRDFFGNIFWCITSYLKFKFPQTRHVCRKSRVKLNWLNSLTEKNLNENFTFTSCQDIFRWFVVASIRDLPPQRCFKFYVKWNLFIAYIRYSGHLFTTDTFLRNGWNDDQTLIVKPLCSGHFIAGTSL